MCYNDTTYEMCDVGEHFSLGLLLRAKDGDIDAKKHRRAQAARAAEAGD